MKLKEKIKKYKGQIILAIVMGVIVLLAAAYQQEIAKQRWLIGVALAGLLFLHGMDAIHFMVAEMMYLAIGTGIAFVVLRSTLPIIWQLAIVIGICAVITVLVVNMPEGDFWEKFSRRKRIIFRVVSY